MGKVTEKRDPEKWTVVRIVHSTRAPQAARGQKVKEQGKLIRKRSMIGRSP